jgi:probable rRNA maturation factor
MLKVTIKNLQKRIELHPQKINRLIRKALREEGADLSGELNVIFVNDKGIQKLNRRYHKRNTATDVLAFNLTGRSKIFLADIIISTDTAIRNAKVYHTRPDNEAALYAIHGLLHLLGYQDSTTKERSIMRRKEDKYVPM